LAARGNRDFVRWSDQHLAQIVDLRQMAETGMLDDPQRSFGVDAPSGRLWYNFDPLTFLERGAAWAFGDWDLHDDDDAPTWQIIATIPWDDFADYLRAGQGYE
jgi:hypothetical protein